MIFRLLAKTKLSMIFYLIPWILTGMFQWRDKGSCGISMVDVAQAGDNTTLHVETYLMCVFQYFGWTHLIPASLTMNPSNYFIQSHKLLPCLQITENIWTRHVLDIGHPAMNLYGVLWPLSLWFIFLLSNLVSSRILQHQYTIMVLSACYQLSLCVALHVKDFYFNFPFWFAQFLLLFKIMSCLGNFCYISMW